MLSVGIFTYSTRPRGSVVHACALAEALCAAGHSATLYALSKAGDGFYRELSCKVVLLPAAPAPADPDQLIAQRVAEMAAGFDSVTPIHDVYHAEDCLAASGLLESRSPSRPLVRTVHHVEHFESTYLNDCQRRSISKADGVLSVSRLAQSDVSKEFGVRAPIIGNGVVLSRFERRTKTALALRRASLCDSPDARFVLSVGGVEPRKNSLIALAAMKRLMARMPEVHWVVVGGASIWEHAEYRARFEQELLELPEPLRARIHLLGSVGEDELTELYQVSECLLYPSVQEGFGLCALEALAAGTALVVSNIAPFTEYLDASCASLVDPSSAEDVERAVSDLLSDAPLTTVRVRAGSRRVQDHSWARVADAHVAFYRELLGREARSKVDNSSLQAS